MSRLDLKVGEHLLWDSSYHSDIFRAFDEAGKEYRVKKNKGKDVEKRQKIIERICRVKHHKLLKPVDFFIEGGRLVEVYEFVAWPRLNKVLDRVFSTDGSIGCGWSFKHAWRVMEQLTDVLGCLHSHDVVHGDVVPRNFFVNPNGLDLKLFDYSSSSFPYFLGEGVNSRGNFPSEYKGGNCWMNAQFDVYQAGRVFMAMTRREFGDRTISIDISEKTKGVIDRAVSEDRDFRYSSCVGMHEDVVGLKKFIV